MHTNSALWAEAKPQLSCLALCCAGNANHQSWAGLAEDGDSPLLVSYYFFSLLNPGDFLRVR